ncbi:MAG: hypothetical protein OSB70_04875 [Myxococcota bacterium]|nr:hypothetical protein [Myxococcota bacterium]
MESIRLRAKTIFPSVMLTVLSMVQALALELLWTRVVESPAAWTLNWAAFIFWLQIVAALLGFLQIWLFYISIVIRLVWVPSIFDSVIPFGLGIVEFALVELTQPGMMAAWLFAIALLGGSTIASGQWVFIRARREPENREFFESVSRATRQDLVTAGSSSLIVLGMAIVIAIMGEQPAIATVAVLVVIASIGYQSNLTRDYWNRSMREVGDEPVRADRDA